MEQFQDIPKLYTAVAEWAGCVSAVWLCRRFLRKGRITFLAISILLLSLIQLYCGTVSNWQWLLGMAAAVGVMFLTIFCICAIGWRESAYLCLRSFMAAEFIAALEWQIDSFLGIYASAGQTASWILCLSMVFAFFAVYCMVEYKTLPTFVHSSFQPVTALQLRVTAGFVLFFFAFSNLSYLQLDLPFTDEAPKGIFNARTLIDMAGVFALLGLNLSRMEMISVQENIILREAMERQYHQYTAAQEARELINHKYHDLKHHLVVLRRNGENTAELLDAVEKGLDAYETAFDTGNKVLDTILTDKGDLCREKQIEFTVIADGTLLQPVSVADLCTMFGNALDNAIEYEEKVPEVGKRRIALTIRRWNAFVSVVFENYFEGSLAVGDSLPQTTKQEKEYHGYGLSSIKRTAERYGGTMVVSQEDHYFRLKLLLPLGE